MIHQQTQIIRTKNCVLYEMYMCVHHFINSVHNKYIHHIGNKTCMETIVHYTHFFVLFFLKAPILPKHFMFFFRFVLNLESKMKRIL